MPSALPIIEQTGIPDLVIVRPKVFGDQRGWFVESYNEATYHALGITAQFVQDNQAFSRRGVLRGLHYQHHPFAQAKLVRAVQGKVLDVAVDLRSGSPTFGQHRAVLLSADEHTQLFVPRGFAHGYVVLSPTAEFAYKCDNTYYPQAEGGLRYDDPALGIDWGAWSPAELTINEKDLSWPAWSGADLGFTYPPPPTA